MKVWHGALRRRTCQQLEAALRIFQIRHTGGRETAKNKPHQPSQPWPSLSDHALANDDAAAAVDPGDFAKTEAVEYLRLWDVDRSSWKFKKNRQVWLLQNMFHPSSVSRDTFKILLRYLEGMKGAARMTTLKQAQGILEEGVAQPQVVSGGSEIMGVDQAVVDKQRKSTEKLRRIRFGRADALARILA